MSQLATEINVMVILMNPEKRRSDGSIVSSASLSEDLFTTADVEGITTNPTGSLIF